MVKPVTRPKIVKKKTKKFNRYQSDRWKRVKRSWRRPRGIDGRQRRQFKGMPNLVSIGYGSNKKTRYVLPSGFKKFRVFNVRDVELLLMNNTVYAAEIGHAVSAQGRKEILKRAKELDIHVLNANARLRKTDTTDVY